VCTSRKKGGLQTWQPNNRQTASRPEQNLTAEVKIRQLRKLFADAPEVGKTVLENVLQRFASDASKAPPQPVQSAGRGR
jgi:hypothetical protein